MLVVAALLAVPASATGADHLMRVNEVFPAAVAGDQFIEFLDVAGEPYPAFNYRLEYLAADGTPLGGQTFDPPYAFANRTTPFVLAAAGDRDADLAAPIPQGSLQVCFYRTSTVSAGNLIHCNAYGSIQQPAQAAPEPGPQPAAGQSSQLCGSRFLARAPTRGAANTCGSSGGDPGGGGPGDGKSDDTTKPSLALGGKKKQDVDRLAVTVRSTEPATAVVTGSVSVPGASARVKVRKATKAVSAGVKTRIRVKMKRKAKRRVKAALADGLRSRAKLKVTLTDRAGNSTVAKRRIKLKD